MDYEINHGFNDVDGMIDFLKQMEQDTTWITDIQVNQIETSYDPDLGCRLSYGAAEYPIWTEVAMPTLERRSGDTAKGHKLMDEEQIMASMNNYWYLHPEKDKATMMIRGDKVALLASDRYVYIPQSELVRLVVKHLNTNHADKWRFVGGLYSPELTTAQFAVQDAITDRFKRDWANSGLAPSILDNADVIITIQTSDTEQSAARLYGNLKLRASEMSLGQPVVTAHRNSERGAVNEFNRKLSEIDLAISDEFDKLSQLMSVTVYSPQMAMRRAMKSSGMTKVSVKACREYDDQVSGSFGSKPETAFLIYMTLHGVLDTSIGHGFSDAQKWNMITAIHGLVNKDWTKLDKAATVIL